MLNTQARNIVSVLAPPTRDTQGLLRSSFMGGRGQVACKVDFQSSSQRLKAAWLSATCDLGRGHILQCTFS